MLEETNEDTLTLPIANVFKVPFRTAIVVTAIGAVIFFAALAPLATAILVIGAAALLLLVGVGIFHALTCIIKAQYAAGGATAAAAARRRARWPVGSRLCSAASHRATACRAARAG